MLKVYEYKTRTRSEKKKMSNCDHSFRNLCVVIMYKQKHLSQRCNKCTSNKFIPWDEKLAGKRDLSTSAHNMCFYETPEWRSLRYTVLRNSNRACVLCGETKRQIHVDHIKPRSKYPELALDLNNLQVLCIDCNKGKSNIYEDDFRDEGSTIKKL